MQLSLETGISTAIEDLYDANLLLYLKKAHESPIDNVNVCASSPPVSISVVAPVHNRKEITLQCLRSLHSSDLTGLDVRFVIVDDGSTDGTAEAICSAFPNVRLVSADGSLYYTRGTNLGVRVALESCPDFILTINDDSVFHRHSLRRMVQLAQQYPRSAVGPLSLRWDRPLTVYQFDPQWNTKAGGWQYSEDTLSQSIQPEIREVSFLPGNCILSPSNAFTETGLLKEWAFPYGWGDSEFSPRLRRLGWKLLVDTRAWIWIQPNGAAPSIQKPSNLVHELFVDRRSYRHVMTTFFRLWYGAPNRRKGLFAFVFLMLRGLPKILKR